MFKNIQDFNNVQEINRADEDGNTTLHLIMRNFNVDHENSAKIARGLLKNGANVKVLNKN